MKINQFEYERKPDTKEKWCIVNNNTFSNSGE